MSQRASSSVISTSSPSVLGGFPRSSWTYLRIASHDRRCHVCFHYRSIASGVPCAIRLEEVGGLLERPRRPFGPPARGRAQQRGAANIPTRSALSAAVVPSIFLCAGRRRTRSRVARPPSHAASSSGRSHISGVCPPLARARAPVSSKQLAQPIDVAAPRQLPHVAAVAANELGHSGCCL